jgi:hypothetical protein
MALIPAEERAFTAYREAGHLVAALAFRVMPRGALRERSGLMAGRAAAKRKPAIVQKSQYGGSDPGT